MSSQNVVTVFKGLLNLIKNKPQFETQMKAGRSTSALTNGDPIDRASELFVGITRISRCKPSGYIKGSAHRPGGCYSVLFHPQILSQHRHFITEALFIPLVSFFLNEIDEKKISTVVFGR